MKTENTTLNTASVTLYISNKDLPENLQKEQEDFKSWFIKNSQKDYPSIDFWRCHLWINAILIMDLYYDFDLHAYQTDFSISFECMFLEPKTGNIICNDVSDGKDIKLSDDEIKAVKKAIFHEFTDTLF